MDDNIPVLSGKRITVLAGHYGSGKTQLAVHLALELRKRHERVTLCDLDIVNPYFRTIDSRDILKRADVRLISSVYAGSNVETPGFPPETASVFDNPEVTAVIDVGGDDRGALALGRYGRPSGISPEHALYPLSGAAILLVVNKYRPLSADAKDAAAICREIESAGRFCFTGIVNNSNLGSETTAADVLASLPYAEEIGKTLSLPVVAVSVMRTLEDELRGQIQSLWCMDIYRKWVTI